jgi:hypothetical protein
MRKGQEGRVGLAKSILPLLAFLSFSFFISMGSVLADDQPAAAASMAPQQLKLQVVPVKDVFKATEKIAFDLVLTNTGNTSLQVKELGAKSAFCQIDKTVWGSKNPSGPDIMILDPGFNRKIRLKVAHEEPGEVTIECSYGVGFKGVRPSDKKTVRVE